MAVAPAESNIDKLPDDALTEVMLRVPRPADLVHAAVVSKPWRRVIARQKFLGNYRKRHKSKSSPFLGIYIPRKFGGLPSFEKADSIQSAKSADLDLQRAAAMAFSLDGLESDPEWRLLDCYNGRLLLAKGNKSLEVYNPLCRERIPVALPKDGILPDDFSACLLQGHGDEASSFRVVSVQHKRPRRVRAVEYDSRWESWKDHPWEILGTNIRGTQQVEVMHAGNLVFCKYTAASLLLLDTSKMEFSALPLPADNNHQNYAIGEMEDGVCCFASVDSVGIWNKIHLRLWKLEKLEWKLEKRMLVDQVLGEHAVLRGMYYRVRAVTNGIALLCLTSRENQLSFVVDLRTFGVKDKFEFKDIAFPMHIPWPPTFSNAREGLGIQDPVASVPTPTASEECFEGESPDIRERQNVHVINKARNHVYAVMNPAAALGGEAEGAKTDGKSDEEDTETGGENEDAAEDPNTECARRGEVKGVEPDGEIEEESAETAGENEGATEDSDTEGDDVEESPPSLHHRRKRAATPDPTPEDDEAEEILTPLCRHRRRKLGEHGDSLPDHLRCGRKDGKKWRCSARALPTVSFCEYHYAKANKGKIKKVPADGEVLAVAKIDFHRQRQSREHGDSLPLPDHLRCGRTDGKKWRCSARALPTVSFCKYHYTKANKGKIKKVPADGEVLAVAKIDFHRQRQSRERGDSLPLPDHLRCGRTDGKKWCCSARALPTVSFCEYHYTKANKGKINKVPADGEVLAVAKIDFHRQQQSRERGDSLPLPDHLRCSRRDGKKWRCSRRALPTVSFCEYHYTKAKMGKKLPADGEVLAVVRERLKKNKRKGRKNINPMVLPQATTSDCQTRDLPNVQMTISPSDRQTSGPAAVMSPVTMKVGVEIPAPIQRCYGSNNAVPLPGPVKGAPCETSMTKEHQEHLTTAV